MTQIYFSDCSFSSYWSTRCSNTSIVSGGKLGSSYNSCIKMTNTKRWWIHTNLEEFKGQIVDGQQDGW